VRLRMLSLVAAEDEVCSCALEEPLGKSQPTISHHTRILAEADSSSAKSVAGGCGGESYLNVLGSIEDSFIVITRTNDRSALLTA